MPTSSSHADALRQQAEAAFAAHDWNAAFAGLDQAEHAAPRDLGLRLRHAALLAAAGRFTAAARRFRDLVDRAPAAERPAMRVAVGVEWQRAGRADLAEPLLRVLDAHPGMPVHAHAARAEALERLNRVAESRERAAHALRRYPGDPALVLALARAQRRMGDLHLAETALRPLVAGPSPVAVAAGYELGHVLDAASRESEALAAFAAAKKIQRRHAAEPLAAWCRQMAKLEDPKQDPTPADFAAWAAKTPSNPLRCGVLFGCPRSGTTLLERVLGGHPDVCAVSEMPVLYASGWMPLVRGHASCPYAVDVLRAASEAMVQHARADYGAGMAEAAESPLGPRLLLDKNPSLLGSLPVVSRLLPEAKLIMALRDPRALVWSCYTQHLPLNAESAAFLDLTSCARHVAALLGYWHRLRERIGNPWLEVRYEDVVADLPGQARRATDFLGLPWREELTAFDRRMDAARSPSYAAVAQPLYTRAIEHWRRYAAPMAACLAPLREAQTRLGYAD